MEKILISIASVVVIIVLLAVTNPDKSSKCEALENDRSMFVPARCFDNFNSSK